MKEGGKLKARERAAMEGESKRSDLRSLVEAIKASDVSYSTLKFVILIALMLCFR